MSSVERGPSYPGLNAMNKVRAHKAYIVRIRLSGCLAYSNKSSGRRLVKIIGVRLYVNFMTLLYGT